jgi:hypothetical protein
MSVRQPLDAPDLLARFVVDADSLAGCISRTQPRSRMLALWREWSLRGVAYAPNPAEMRSLVYDLVDQVAPTQQSQVENLRILESPGESLPRLAAETWEELFRSAPSKIVSGATISRWIVSLAQINRSIAIMDPYLLSDCSSKEPWTIANAKHLPLRKLYTKLGEVAQTAAGQHVNLFIYTACAISPKSNQNTLPASSAAAATAFESLREDLPCGWTATLKCSAKVGAFHDRLVAVGPARSLEKEALCFSIARSIPTDNPTVVSVLPNHAFGQYWETVTDGRGAAEHETP